MSSRWLLALVFVVTPLLALPQAVVTPAAECAPTDDGRCVPPPLPPGQLPPVPPGLPTAAPSRPSVLVKHTPAVSASTFETQLRSQGLADVEGLLTPRWWRAGVPDGQTADQVVARLRALPEVEAAEAESEVRVFAVPTDPYFSAYQWALPRIQAPAAWEQSGGSAGVWIAVVDTGIDYGHPDRPANLRLGYDFANRDDDPFDDHRHGTHVAGIAAAATNNGIGVAGLCPSCEVLAVKVIGANGNGSTRAVADGITYAADWGAYYRKRTIINLSLGTPLHSQVISDAVDHARGLGALVVAAAGNNGAGPPAYPAALAGVAAVAATDAADRPTSYSQYGGIAAPGGDGSASILSTVPLWYGSPPYAFAGGTSMASPHVAGAAGLVWSLFPACSAAQVATELRSTTDEPAGWSGAYGSGRLNVDRAIVRFTTSTLPPAAVGAAYGASVTAAGGAGGKTFSLASGGLPPGLSLDPASGTIAGAPTQAGDYAFVLRVADALCETSDRSFTVSVRSPATGPAPTATPGPPMATPGPGTSRVLLPLIARNASTAT